MEYQTNRPPLLQTINEFNSPVGANYLSSKLDISPATIGRQLKKLEDNGYLTCIGNKGRVLTDKGKSFLTNLNSLEVQKSAARSLIDYSSEASFKRIHEILQIRHLIESYTVTSACENATDEQLEFLELLSMEHLLELKKGNNGAEQDLKIHLAIAEFSKNEIAQQILKILLADNNVYNVFNHISSSLKRSEITRHDKLVEALQNRDPIAAKEEMKEHLDRILENVNDYIDSHSNVSD